MAFFERERRRFVKDRDSHIGRRAADSFFDKVQRHPGGKRLLKKLSHDPVGEFGIPESSYKFARKLNEYPEEVAEWFSTMSSSILAEDLAQDYIRIRSQRVATANIFRQLGLKGKDLGFVMDHLYQMAVENARPRRRRIDQ